MIPIKRKLAPQDVLFKEGDASSSFFVILNGVVSLFNDRGGRSIEKARLSSNAVVGDLIFTHPQPRTTSARAITTCEIVEFPFDQINADLKTLPGWTQLLLRSLPDQLLSAQKDLKELKHDEDTGSKFSADDLLRGIACLRIALASLEPEDGVWRWEKIREYALQVFQFPPLKLEPVIQALNEVNWIKTADHDGELTTVTTPESTRLLEFENFVRHYRHSRNKRSMIEVNPTDFVILSSLVTAAEGKIDAKGSAHVQLSDALSIAQQMPNGGSVRVDQFDVLMAKGLDVSKTSTDSGLSLAFNYSELEKIRAYWQLLVNLQS